MGTLIGICWKIAFVFLHTFSLLMHINFIFHTFMKQTFWKITIFFLIKCFSCVERIKRKYRCMSYTFFEIFKLFFAYDSYNLSEYVEKSHNRLKIGRHRTYEKKKNIRLVEHHFLLKLWNSKISFSLSLSISWIIKGEVLVELRVVDFFYGGKSLFGEISHP